MNNILVVGSFEGTISIGDTMLTSAGDGDLIVLKYDPEGNLRWARQAGGTLDDGDYGDIKADDDGNVFVVSSVEGAASFVDTTLVSRGRSDVILAKYDSGGELRWVIQAGGSGQDNGTGIALGSSGDIFITGRFEGMAEFGGVALISMGLSDGFISELVDDEITAIGQEVETIPSFQLFQNYPNPFNPETAFRYNLPSTSNVQLSIYSILGHKIRTLIRTRQSSGDHQIKWDGRDDSGVQVSSGVYLFKLQAGSAVAVRKMLLIR